MLLKQQRYFYSNNVPTIKTMLSHFQLAKSSHGSNKEKLLTQATKKLILLHQYCDTTELFKKRRHSLSGSGKVSHQTSAPLLGNAVFCMPSVPRLYNQITPPVADHLFLPRLEISSRHLRIKIAAPAKQGSP
jgi:hypothetical protein